MLDWNRFILTLYLNHFITCLKTVLKEWNSFVGVARLAEEMKLEFGMEFYIPYIGVIRNDLKTDKKI